MEPRYIGVVCDNYTPQVEGQLLRDLIRMQNMPETRNRDIVVVSKEARMDRLLSSLRMRRSEFMDLARVFIKYKTQEEWPEVPEHATVEIERNLWVAPGRSSLDPQTRPGYYLPPQGRLIPDQISLKRPAPNGYTPVDPALIVLWS